MEYWPAAKISARQVGDDAARKQRADKADIKVGVDVARERAALKRPLTRPYTASSIIMLGSTIGGIIVIRLESAGKAAKKAEGPAAHKTAKN